MCVKTEGNSEVHPYSVFAEEELQTPQPRPSSPIMYPQTNTKSVAHNRQYPDCPRTLGTYLYLPTTILLLTFETFAYVTLSQVHCIVIVCHIPI